MNDGGSALLQRDDLFIGMWCDGELFSRLYLVADRDDRCRLCNLICVINRRCRLRRLIVGTQFFGQIFSGIDVQAKAETGNCFRQTALDRFVDLDRRDLFKRDRVVLIVHDRQVFHCCLMIVSINGAQISNEEDIQAQTKNLQVGDTVNMVIRRNGRDYKVDITLTEYKG